MKNLKEPKNFNYPRLYWRPRNNDEPKLAAELIIIEPNWELSERTALYENEPFGECYLFNGLNICWMEKGMTMKQQIKAMKEFEKEYNIKSLFIGEIK